MFLRLPDVQNTIFRCPNAIGYARGSAIFGALGPRLHAFFGLFLKRPSFARNFAFVAPFFFIFSESLGKDVENISAKGFQKLILCVILVHIRNLREKCCNSEKKSTSI